MKIGLGHTHPYGAAQSPVSKESTNSASGSESDRQQVVLEFDARSVSHLDQVNLKGSFDPATGEYSDHWNGGSTIPMRDDGKGGDRKAGDGIFTASIELKRGQDHQFQWGAVDRDGRWLVTTEEPPKFQLDPQAEVTAANYAPVGHHLYGLHREGEDGFRLRTWAPESDAMSVEVFDRDGEFIQSLPMKRVPNSGDWKLSMDRGFRTLEGSTYRLASRDTDGNIVSDYADPFARHLEGQQRGLERIFVDPVLGFETGWYDDSSKGGPNYADNPLWGRFSVDGQLEADRVELILRDENGTRLDRDRLMERVGAPKLTPYDQADPADQRDVDVLRSWQLAETAPLTPYFWSNSVSEDGRIEMTRVDSNMTAGGWTTVVNSYPELQGLKYEFHAYKDGELIGDSNNDGILSEEERRATPFNERRNTITERPGSARNSLFRISPFEPKHRSAPRREPDISKAVIYEAHVGSFLAPADNAVAPTFADMAKNLDYLAELGATAIELLPTQEFGGKRDWGYTPDFYFAGTDAYGFQMSREEALEHSLLHPHEQEGQEQVWIDGTDALKFFVDQAHLRGFQVLGDVVYNHTSGKADGDNPVAAIDGDQQSFFRWPNGNFSYTPWGAKPNYADQGVKDFLANHATQQLDEFGFDGLRFDFTQVLHNEGPAEEQVEGMNALRQINRSIDLMQPGAFKVAEDFSRNWLVAADYDQSEWQGGILKKGMGFDRVWNDHARDGILHIGSGQMSMDRVVNGLLEHQGVSGWDRGVLYAHSHDEVGNSGKWVARDAAGSKHTEDIMQAYPRAVARTGAVQTLLGPGMPMLWQGEEFLANNDFKHGLTSTWGQETDWLTTDSPSDVDVFRQGHFQVYKDAIALRQSSDAFRPEAAIHRVYTHNDDRVMAFSRSGAGEEFIVVSNVGDQDRHDYSIGLPEGRWAEVLNTDSEAYGGRNVGNAGATLEGGQGMTLPAGGTVVLKRV